MPQRSPRVRQRASTCVCRSPARSTSPRLSALYAENVNEKLSSQGCPASLLAAPDAAAYRTAAAEIAALHRGHRAKTEGNCRDRRLAGSRSQRRALVEELVGTLEVALEEHDAAERHERRRSRRRRGVPASSERALEALLSFSEIGALQPEPMQRRRQCESVGATIIGRETPPQRRAKVVVLQLETVQPEQLVSSRQFRLCASSQVEEETEVPGADGVGFARPLQTLPAIVTHCFEKPIPMVSVTDRVHENERLVDKPGHQVEHVVVIDSVADADVLGSLECPAA